MTETSAMSMRDWLAGLALAGMLAKADIHAAVSATTLSASSGTLHLTDEQLAERAYHLADSMLKVRGRELG